MSATSGQAEPDCRRVISRKPQEFPQEQHELLRAGVCVWSCGGASQETLEGTSKTKGIGNGGF